MPNLQVFLKKADIMSDFKFVLFYTKFAIISSLVQMK